MGSGKGNIKRLYALLGEQDELTPHYDSFLKDDRFLKDRNDYLIKDVQTYPSDSGEVHNRAYYAQTYTKVFLDLIEEKPSIDSGDQVVSFPIPFRISEKDWRRIYDDHMASARRANPDMEKDELLYVVIHKFREYANYPDRVRNIMGYSSASEQFMGVFGQRDHRPVPITVAQDAIENIHKGKSPYSRNPFARGLPVFDLGEDSPTNRENQYIRQKVIKSVETFDTLLEKTKELRPDLAVLGGGVVFGDFGDVANAQGYYENYYDRITITKSTYKGLYDYNKYSFTTALAGTIFVDVPVHEYAHALNEALYKKHIKNGNPSDPLTQKFMSYGNLFYFDEDPPSTQIIAVSPYGNSNKLEAFAEAFTMYARGDEPKGVGTEYFNTFKSFMRDMGLDSIKGITRYYARPLKNEVFYTNTKVEVIKNPTQSQYNQITREFNESGFVRFGEPAYRKTYDLEGNEYIWRADQSTHYAVEDYIDKTYNTLTHQAKNFDLKYEEATLNKFVQTRTLPADIKPKEGSKLAFSINGKDFNVSPTEKDKSLGYLTRQVNNVQYFIDVESGAILKQRPIKKRK